MAGSAKKDMVTRPEIGNGTKAGAERDRHENHKAAVEDSGLQKPSQAQPRELKSGDGNLFLKAVSDSLNIEPPLFGFRGFVGRPLFFFKHLLLIFYQLCFLMDLAPRCHPPATEGKYFDLNHDGCQNAHVTAPQKGITNGVSS
jgi:hypothetical protein